MTRAMRSGTFRMPYEGVPIRGNKHGAPAGPQNAECLGHNAIHVGDVLGDLSAGNNIEGSIGLIYIGRISHSCTKATLAGSAACRAQ